MAGLLVRVVYYDALSRPVDTRSGNLRIWGVRFLPPAVSLDFLILKSLPYIFYPKCWSCREDAGCRFDCRNCCNSVAGFPPPPAACLCTVVFQWLSTVIAEVLSVSISRWSDDRRPRQCEGYFFGTSLLRGWRSLPATMEWGVKLPVPFFVRNGRGAPRQVSARWSKRCRCHADVVPVVGGAHAVFVDTSCCGSEMAAADG